MNRLKDKVCVITGCSTGIGRKAAEMFAAEGAKVVIAARRVPKLEACAEGIRTAGGEVTVVPTDITDPAQCDALIAKAVEVYSKIDVLVNVAGQAEVGLHPVDDFSNEELDRIVAVNLKGTMFMTRAATKVMSEQGYGNIIMVSSVSAITGCGAAVYTATKGGLVALTKHTALRYAYKKPTIRCNCICPGTVWTDMTKVELAAQQGGTYSPKANEFNDCVGKHGCADVGVCNTTAIANVLLFLASDESACLNGQVIVGDYGCNL